MSKTQATPTPSVEPARATPSASRAPQSPALLSGLLVLAAGVLSTLALYLFIAHLQSQGRSAAALAMPGMGMRDMTKYWAFPVLQASGLTGLGFAYLSVLLGMQQSGRSAAWLPLSYRQIDRLHRQISLLVIGLVLVHVASTLFDAMGDSWKTVFIPGSWAHQNWPQAAWGYDTGIFSFYLLLLLAPTFYARRGIGPARWRFAHRFVLLFYILAIWHTLVLGADVDHYSWVRPVLWLAQLPLLVLFARRLLTPARPGERAAAAVGWRAWTRYGLVTAAATAAVCVAVIVLTGHSSFIARV